MAEIFLYTKDAHINSMHLKALRDAGYLTVGVTSLEAVKRLPAPMPVPQGQLSLILIAALKVFEGASDYSKARFGESVARTLLASGIEAGTAETAETGSTEGKSPAPSGETPTPDLQTSSTGAS